VTQQQASSHWHQGAKDALEMAKLGFENGKYALALFHCHLAIEKALKAAYIQQKEKEPLKSHDLLLLAESIDWDWQENEKDELDDLSGYSTAARYDDVEWTSQEATKENVENRLKQAEHYVSLLEKSS